MLNVYHTIVMRHISDDSYALVVYERLLYIYIFLGSFHISLNYKHIIYLISSI